ncbi:MFS transporter [Cryptosporangium minutisporangium]|uniref:MFS transporter n=1 Tax=Cryptosporangium minutisporangium TaxID=113569 RepID=UPI0031EC1712
MNSRAALTALGASAFVYVTAEAVPVGLLPEIASDMSVSEADIGLLLTSYAAVAALTSVPLTAVTMRVPRRRLIACTIAAFAVSQLAAAFAPTFVLLVMARMMCALVHGMFWATIAPVAARLVAPEHRGRATARVFLGNSLAIVLGVPLGTALGQWFGWRLVLVGLAVGGAACVAAVLFLLPALPPLPADVATPAGQRLRNAVLVLRSGPLVAVCSVTAVLMTGVFSAYTFLAPLVRRDAGLEGPALSVLLLGFGAAGLVGTWLIGRWIDRYPGLLLSVLITVIIAALALLAPALGPVPTVIAVLAWGAAMTAAPIVLQAAVLRVAPHAADAGSAVYVVAFQIGIGGGSLLGERIVRADRLEALPLVALVLAAVAWVIVRASRRAFPLRLATQPATAAPTPAPPATAPAAPAPTPATPAPAAGGHWVHGRHFAEPSNTPAFNWFQKPSQAVSGDARRQPPEQRLPAPPLDRRGLTQPRNPLWWLPEEIGDTTVHSGAPTGNSTAHGPRSAPRPPFEQADDQGQRHHHGERRFPVGPDHDR